MLQIIRFDLYCALTGEEYSCCSIWRMEIAQWFLAVYDDCCKNIWIYHTNVPNHLDDDCNPKVSSLPTTSAPSSNQKHQQKPCRRAAVAHKNRALDLDVLIYVKFILFMCMFTLECWMHQIFWTYYLDQKFKLKNCLCNPQFMFSIKGAKRARANTKSKQMRRQLNTI